MSRLLEGVFASSGSESIQQIPYSLKFDAGSGHGLVKRVNPGGSRTKFTVSTWIKLSKNFDGVYYIFTTLDNNGNPGAYLSLSSSGLAYWDRRQGADGTILFSNAKFEDQASWYHIVLAVDYTNATTTSRARLYVNGSRVNSLSQANYPNTNEVSYVNALGATHYISAAPQQITGYLSEFYFVDGLDLEPSNFGETVNGKWSAKQYSGSFGQNGFYLPFSNPVSREAIGIDGSKSATSNYYNMTIEGQVSHSNAQARYGSTSLYFDGVTDKAISYDGPLNGGGTRDFTIEGWFRPTTWSTDSTSPGYFRRLWSYGTGIAGSYLGLNIDSSNGTIQIRSGTDTLRASSSSTLPLNAWSHVALSKNSDTVRLFINGTQVASYSESTNFNTAFASEFHLGGLVGQSSGCFQGWIDDFRITKGIGRYIINFTPQECPVGTDDPYWHNVRMLIKANEANGSATVPVNMGTSIDVLGAMQPLKGIENTTGSQYLSTAQSKFGSSSLFCSNAATDSANFLTGSEARNSTRFGSDFTIESWFRPVSGGDRSIYVLHDGSTYLAFNASVTANVFNLYLNSGGASASPSFTFTPNTWYHVALSRSGTGTNNLKLFVNGNIIWQTTNNSVLGYINPTLNRTGGGVSGASHFIDDFRVYNGVGKYTTTFTPPTSALPIGSADQYWDNVVIAMPCESFAHSANVPYYWGTIFNDTNCIVTDTPNEYGNDTAQGGEVRGNYCTIQPLSYFAGSPNVYGALVVSGGNDGFATMGVNSGRWYWETTLTAVGTGGNVPHWGIGIVDYNSGENTVIGGKFADLAWRRNDATGGTYSNLGFMGSYSGGLVAGTTVEVGQTVGHYLDLEANPKTYQMRVGSTLIYNLTFSYDNKKPIRPFIRMNPGCVCVFNFGQSPFLVKPASNFRAWSVHNLPDPAVIQPNRVVDAQLYTGNGGSQTISSYNFSPDLTLIKERTGAFNWAVYDTVRGPLKSLSSSRIDITENNDTTGLSAFNSNGFSFNGDGFYYVNRSGQLYSSFSWDAGDSAPVVNNNGTISTLVKANPSAGFSIYTFNGTGVNGTIGHGLGQVCDLTILKRRDITGANWWLYISKNNYARLNLNSDTSYQQDNGNGLLHTNSLVNSLVVPDSQLNASGGQFLVYSWAQVPGYSSIGLIVGNNSSTNGTHVYTGFKPAIVLVKSLSTTAGSWNIFNNKAQGIGNRWHNVLYPNSPGAEQAYQAISMVSDGFKFFSINTGTGLFNNGDMLYMAFAENPFKYARGA